MRHLSRTVLAFALSCTIAGCGTITAQKKEKDAPIPEKKDAVPTAPAAAKVAVNPALLQDFQQRVASYITLKRDLRVKGTSGTDLKETKDPDKIGAAEDYLAARIRAARAGAKHGDIFTPQISTEFRRLLNPETKGDDGRDAKEILKDDAPAPGVVPLKVNAKYPEGKALPTVPATLLGALPTLPEGVEYRILGKDLILRDADSNIIVDFIPNAIR
jgi:hypothetical protein